MSALVESARARVGATRHPGRLLEEQGRFRQVDAIRGLACISVLVYHVSFRFPFPRSQLMQYLTQHNSGPPAICLVVFFTISGFVIYRPFVAARWDGKPMPPLLPYATRRFVRIVPAYWVALLVAGVWMNEHYLYTPTGFLRYFCFLQLYANHTIINGGIPVAWSLSVEMTFYALLPLLALWARRLGARFGRFGSECAVLVGMIVVSITYQVIVLLAMPHTDLTILSVLCFLPGCLDLFAGGMLLAVLSVDAQRREVKPRWWEIINRYPWLPWLGSAIAIGVAGQIPGGYGRLTSWWLITLVLKPIGATLLLTPLVFGEDNRGLIRRILGIRPLVFVGTVSYAFYLWHYQLLLKLEGSLIPHGELYMTVVLIALSLVAGALSWYLLERPTQRLAARWLRARRAAARAPA
ncbi:MAG TPA: acyltransferase [Solirubrobacteraceae bacterium]|nr:acyltransferase [Solirubrobacteraceae bacterium]